MWCIRDVLPQAGAVVCMEIKIQRMRTVLISSVFTESKNLKELWPCGDGSRRYLQKQLKTQTKWTTDRSMGGKITEWLKERKMMSRKRCQNKQV